MLKLTMILWFIWASNIHVYALT